MALTRAHLALAAAAIRFRPSAEILRKPDVELLPFAAGDCFLNFAHLAFWAAAIRFLAAADIVLFGRVPLPQAIGSDYEVVATVGDGRKMVRAVAELRPHLVIVDIAMPLLNGLDAGQQAKELFPAVKLVFLTMNPDTDIAAEAFRRSASGYLLKSCAASELVVAVREVLPGKPYLSPKVAKDRGITSMFSNPINQHGAVAQNRKHGYQGSAPIPAIFLAAVSAAIFTLKKCLALSDASFKNPIRSATEGPLCRCKGCLHSYR